MTIQTSAYDNDVFWTRSFDFSSYRQADSKMAHTSSYEFDDLPAPDFRRHKPCYAKQTNLEQTSGDMQTKWTRRMGHTITFLGHRLGSRQGPASMRYSQPRTCSKRLH